MRISDWSSDVCSSDLLAARRREFVALAPVRPILVVKRDGDLLERQPAVLDREPAAQAPARIGLVAEEEFHGVSGFPSRLREGVGERSEEHTSELQSLMRISYAVFCLKKKHKQTSQ